MIQRVVLNILVEVYLFGDKKRTSKFSNPQNEEDLLVSIRHAFRRMPPKPIDQ